MTTSRPPRPVRPPRRDAWRRWAAAGVLGAVPLVVLWAGAARADDGTTRYQAPGALSWYDPKDSRGISVWQYEMSLDRGGVTSPGKFLWSFFIDLYWQLYRAGVVFAIWLVDWVLSFDWLQILATPVLALSTSLSTVVDRFGATPVLLTAAAVVAVVWMARGKWALGITELLMSLVLASLAVGALADPVGSVAGPDGILVQSRDLGLEVADGLAHDGGTSASTEQLRERSASGLADTFIRLPAQMINFGTVLDGGKCEKVYDQALRGGPYGEESNIRDAVAGCDSALGEVAANPGPGQAVSAMVITPAAALVLLFAMVLSGAVFLAALKALYQSLKLIVTLVTGLLPGRARGALWHTVSDLVMALVTLVYAIVFLNGFLLLIQEVFKSAEPGAGAIPTFYFLDVLLLAGVVLFWRGRSSLSRASDRLAEALAVRPGGAPTALPDRPNLSRAVVTAGKVVAGAHALRTMSRRFSSTGPARSTPAEQSRADADPAEKPPPAEPSAEDRRAKRTASANRRRGAGSDRLPRSGKTAKLLRQGTRATLIVATGGGSTVASAATTAANFKKVTATVKNTRRVALAAKLAASQTGGARSRPSAARKTAAETVARTAPPGYTATTPAQKASQRHQEQAAAARARRGTSVPRRSSTPWNGKPKDGTGRNQKPPRPRMPNGGRRPVRPRRPPPAR